MTKPLVIFDFDGVLVDTAEFLKKEFFAGLSALGYRFLRSPKEAEKLFQENIADALIAHGVTPEHLCAVWERVQQAERRADIQLAPGIEAMLEELHPLCTMAVVSVNGVELIREILGRCGVLRCFTSISGGDEDVAKVRRIAECVQAAGVSSDRAIAIGDTVGDIGEAREAGVTAVAAVWGLHSEKRLAQASPDCIVHTPAEIVDLVKAIAASGAA